MADTNINVSSARSSATDIGTAGSNWTGDWESRKGAISGAEGSVPFGRDQLGQQLLASYQPASDSLKPAGNQVSDGLLTLSSGIAGAVESVAEQDAANRRGMPA